jgi:hypothetical protein
MLEGADMSRRSPQRGTLVVLLGLLVWLLAAACGGEDGAATTAPSTGSVPTAASTTTSVSVSTNSTTTATSTTAALVDGIPAKYVESFGQRPIVVLFYVPGGVEDEKVLKVVNELSVAFREYTFLTYDYRAPAAYGDLAQALKITYQPQLVLIDRNANKYMVWSGYVDKGTLNQSLVNLGRL